MCNTAVVVALAFVLHGCAVRTPQPPPLPSQPRDARALLGRDLSDLFNASAYAHAQWAAAVSSLRTAEPLYTLNASRLMIPASSQKLLTAAAAAERLGWDYRFTTRILATGP
ncbi:MAG: D-alanyl-D-alanine carboxypeptidase, partial [Planctomycetaceae bacterium]